MLATTAISSSADADWHGNCNGFVMSCGAVIFAKQRSVIDLLFISVWLLVLLPTLVAGQSLTLAWNPSNSANIAGYRLHFGTASGSYSEELTVAGNTNSATITGLAAGTTYYFAAAAFNQAGNEGRLSAETSYTLPDLAVALSLAAPVAQPPAPALSLPVRTGRQLAITVTGVTGQRCAIQMSTDLVNWVSVQTNTVPFTFTATNTAMLPQCFYRTCNL